MIVIAQMDPSEVPNLAGTALVAFTICGCRVARSTARGALGMEVRPLRGSVAFPGAHRVGLHARRRRPVIIARARR